VRFQTTETVSTGDVEQVLRALELSLRENFDAVEREGRQIVLHGLGPSPKVRNYRDTTVFEVVSNKGKTIIHADVSFQASALLGASSQDSVVQTKLNSTFEQMRARLNLPQSEIPAPRLRHVAHEESLRVEIDEHSAHSVIDAAKAIPSRPGVLHRQSDSEFKEFSDVERFRESGHSRFARAMAVATHIEEEPVDTVPDTPITIPEVEPLQRPVVPSQGAATEETTVVVSSAAREPLLETPVLDIPIVDTPVQNTLVLDQPSLVKPQLDTIIEVSPPPEPLAPITETMPAKVVVPVAVESAAPAPAAPLKVQPSSSGSHATVFGQLASRLDSGIRRRASFSREGSEAPTVRFVAAGITHKTGVPLLIGTILAVVAAAGSVYLYWAGLFNLDFAHKIISHPAPAPSAPPPPEVIVTQAPPPPPRHQEANPKLWLEQWVDALRGRDPELQASFYADTVDHYLGDSSVSKDELTTEFRSAIQARDGLWTVKLENISVNPLASDHVTVRLTKHFMQMDDSQDKPEQIADHYVKSRLELRKFDGEWKIVSEQDQVGPGRR
jgi:hypothetical protein